MAREPNKPVEDAPETHRGAERCEGRRHAEEAGMAALSLLEGALILLAEKAIFEDHEIDEIFEAAKDAHAEQASGAEGESRDRHKRVRALLSRLQAHGNSVRLR